MAELTKTAYETKYNNASTGLFKTGQSRGIGSDDLRTHTTDLKDSVVWTEDKDSSLDLVSVSLVAGSPNTVTLNMNSQRARRFLISSTLSLDFTLAISNVTNFRILNFLFDCDAEIEITMPTSPDTVMVPSSGTTWTGGVLTVPAGIHALAIENDGTYYRAILIEGFVT